MKYQLYINLTNTDYICNSIESVLRILRCCSIPVDKSQIKMYCHDDYVTDYSDKQFKITKIKENTKIEDTTEDAVNSPKHYITGKIEVIDFIEDKELNFHLGNVIKYVARAGKKHSEGKTDEEKGLEDLKKALWYLQREIEVREGNE